MPQNKHLQKSPKFYVYWQLLVTSQVLKAAVSNRCGITSILYVGMFLQNVFLPSVYADRMNTHTWSWLLHSELCRCCSGACVSVYILQKNTECGHKLLKTAQPNPTLPGWKRSIGLDYVVCIEECGGETGPIFKKMIAKGTLENCHYTVHYKVSLPPQTKQWYIFASNFAWKSPKHHLSPLLPEPHLHTLRIAFQHYKKPLLLFLL